MLHELHGRGAVVESVGHALVEPATNIDTGAPMWFVTLPDKLERHLAVAAEAAGIPREEWVGRVLEHGLLIEALMARPGAPPSPGFQDSRGRRREVAHA